MAHPRTMIQYADPFSNEFFVRRTLTNADGTLAYDQRRVSEFELRKINDNDINDTLENAKHDVRVWHTLPTPKVNHAKRGYFAGMVL